MHNVEETIYLLFLFTISNVVGNFCFFWIKTKWNTCRKLSSFAPTLISIFNIASSISLLMGFYRKGKEDEEKEQLKREKKEKKKQDFQELLKIGVPLISELLLKSDTKKSTASQTSNAEN